MRYDVEKPEHILEHSIQQVKKTTQHLTGQMEGLNSLEVNVAGTMGCTITVLYIVNEHTHTWLQGTPLYGVNDYNNKKQKIINCLTLTI